MASEPIVRHNPDCPSGLRFYGAVSGKAPWTPEENAHIHGCPECIAFLGTIVRIASAARRVLDAENHVHHEPPR